jgi:hypothetical protein
MIHRLQAEVRNMVHRQHWLTPVLVNKVLLEHKTIPLYIAYGFLSDALAELIANYLLSSL